MTDKPRLPDVTRESFLGVFRRRADSWRPLVALAKSCDSAALWGSELLILAAADHIDILEEQIKETGSCAEVRKALEQAMERNERLLAQNQRLLDKYDKLTTEREQQPAEAAEAMEIYSDVYTNFVESNAIWKQRPEYLYLKSLKNAVKELSEKWRNDTCGDTVYQGGWADGQHNCADDLVRTIKSVTSQFRTEDAAGRKWAENES
jgi:carboxypeptidase C (cathepsin A)